MNLNLRRKLCYDKLVQWLWFLNWIFIQIFFRSTFLKHGKNSVLFTMLFYCIISQFILRRKLKYYTSDVLIVISIHCTFHGFLIPFEGLFRKELLFPKTNEIFSFYWLYSKVPHFYVLMFYCDRKNIVIVENKNPFIFIIWVYCIFIIIQLGCSVRNIMQMKVACVSKPTKKEIDMPTWKHPLLLFTF